MRRRYAPEGIAASAEEEYGYRRGFDQGAWAALRAAGIEPDRIQNLGWKERLQAWRYGRKRLVNPMELSNSEKRQIRAAIRQVPVAAPEASPQPAT